MTSLLYAFGFIVLAKLVFNIQKQIQCKRYLKKYFSWLRDPDWTLSESKSQVIRLFEKAGVEDSYLRYAEPAGYGTIATGQASVFHNFPSNREDAATRTIGMFYEAIGVYRSRALNSLNPLYWIEFVINLPEEVLGWLGVSPENIVIKIAKLIYWLIAAAAGFLYSLYKPEIDVLVKEWLNRLVP